MKLPPIFPSKILIKSMVHMTVLMVKVVSLINLVMILMHISSVFFLVVTIAFSINMMVWNRIHWVLVLLEAMTW